MVTSRRKIRTEQDRFGGYATRQTLNNETDYELDTNYEVASPLTDSFSFSSNARIVPEKEVKETSLYSARPEYPQTAEFVGDLTYPVRKRKTVKRETEDVMPSIKTRAYLDPKTEAYIKAQPVKSERTKADPKTKTMLALYLAVVVVLAAVVIATGIAISGLTGGVSALESELGLKNAILLQQNNELSALEDDVRITGGATDLGMAKPSTKKELELIPTRDTVKYEAKTNWFDKLCDWLSNIIGG